jgi:hypothetical protein
MMKTLRKPKTIVEVCQEPLLGGIQKALKWSNQLDIINRYKYETDLFLLCVDKDNDLEREAQLRNLEKLAAEELAKTSKKQLFLAVQAEQELEVWILAGQDLPKEWAWKDIRSEHDPKERYFVPFTTSRDLIDERDQGRGTLSKESASRYDRIKQLCPELADLENRVRNWLEN